MVRIKGGEKDIMGDKRNLILSKMEGKGRTGRGRDITGQKTELDHQKKSKLRRKGERGVTDGRD